MSMEIQSKLFPRITSKELKKIKRSEGNSSKSSIRWDIISAEYAAHIMSIAQTPNRSDNE